MISKDQIEDATRAYLYSYDLAFKEVRNPDLATQAAMSVVMAVLMVNKPQQKQVNPFQIIFESIAAQAQQRAAEEEIEKEGESDHDRPEDAGD